MKNYSYNCKPNLIVRGNRYKTNYASIISAISCGVIEMFAPQILSLFFESQQMIENATPCIRILFILFGFYGAFLSFLILLQSVGIVLITAYIF